MRNPNVTIVSRGRHSRVTPILIYHSES